MTLKNNHSAMKRFYVCGAAVSLPVLIVLISGCTSGPADEPAATGMSPMDMSGDMATPVATTGPATSQGPVAGQGIMPASLFDHARFVWYQYKISAGSMGMPMVHTYRYDNVTYLGRQARHANITMDMLPDALIYLDIWTDARDGVPLSIHEIAFDHGSLSKNADIDSANYSKWEAADLASPKFTAASLQPAGAETVTAGSKTYAATKYTGVTGGQTYTYWVSRDVPVPVKLIVHDAKSDTIYVLSGWG
jgi:hypothetical protein